MSYFTSLLTSAEGVRRPFTYRPMSVSFMNRRKNEGKNLTFRIQARMSIFY